MKFFKKTGRVIRLLCFIVLATVGIGLSGGIPMTMSNRKENNQPITIELVEEIEEKEESELEKE